MSSTGIRKSYIEVREERAKYGNANKPSTTAVEMGDTKGHMRVWVEALQRRGFKVVDENHLIVEHFVNNLFTVEECLIGKTLCDPNRVSTLLTGAKGSGKTRLVKELVNVINSRELTDHFVGCYLRCSGGILPEICLGDSLSDAVQEFYHDLEMPRLDKFTKILEWLVDRGVAPFVVLDDAEAFFPIRDPTPDPTYLQRCELFARNLLEIPTVAMAMGVMVGSSKHLHKLAFPDDITRRSYHTYGNFNHTKYRPFHMTIPA